MVGRYELPHACESQEVTARLAALSPRQRRVLRDYVWRVELGEMTVTEWLRSEDCPVAERSWYQKGSHANYLHSPVFAAALAAYVKAGIAWSTREEERQIGRARARIVNASPSAAGRLVEQAEADMSGLLQVQYVWLAPEDVLPSQAILGKRSNPHPLIPDVFLTEYLVARTCLDTDRLRQPRYARLVRKFKDSPKSGIEIEFYDAQHAAESILDRADKATANKAAPAEAASVTIYLPDNGRDDDQTAAGSAEPLPGEPG